MTKVSIKSAEREKQRHRRKQSPFEVVHLMCEQIDAFKEEHDAQECKAYISLDNGLAGLFLVTTKEAYDFELGEKLAEFAAPLIERGLLSSVTLLPASSPEQLAAFFDPRKAIRLGEGNA